MILDDQFQNTPDDTLIVFSSKNDGTVLDRAVGLHDPSIVTNRTKFTESVGVSYGDTVFQRIIYADTARYDLIADVDERSMTKYTSEVVADALFTRQSGVAMLLPVADCVVSVVYDPKNRYIAQAHLGRHSTFADLMQKLLNKFVSEGSTISDLRVWMEPSAQRSSYKLEYFDLAGDPRWEGLYDKKSDGYYIDMQGYNKQACLSAGVLEQNITMSPIDTCTNDDYFSHSRGDTAGRFAGLAMMR